MGCLKKNGFQKKILVVLSIAVGGLFFVLIFKPILPISNAKAGSVEVTALVAEVFSTTTLPVTGGSVTFNNIDNTFAKLDAPQNYYSSSLVLNFFSYSNSAFQETKPPPSGKNFVGKVYDLNLLDSSGDEVHSVSKPVEITLSYTASDISGFDENSLAVYRKDSSDTSWSLVSGSVVDTTQHAITFSTDSFSSFAVMAVTPVSPPPPSPSPSPPPSGGSGGGGGLAYPTHLPLPLEEKNHAIGVADFNGDGRVDIVDLSIMLYYFGENTKTNPAATKFDLNGDGKVDIIDISILLYYWTT